MYIETHIYKRVFYKKYKINIKESKIKYFLFYFKTNKY